MSMPSEAGQSGAAKKKGAMTMKRLVLSVAVCVAVFQIARSIPFCPMCEGLKPEDLGLLAHGISCGP